MPLTTRAPVPGTIKGSKGPNKIDSGLKEPTKKIED